MRESIASMLVLCGALSTPLIAQTRGPSWMTGLAATLGGEWQIQGVDFGVVRPIRFGPMRYVSAAARIGTFANENSIASGPRGFVGGIALAAETPLVPIVDVGTEQSPARVAFGVTLEASGYLAANSPFPQGGRWLGLAVLPGVRTIQTESIGFGVMVGPIAFIGRETDVRALLSVRIEIPLAPSDRGVQRRTPRTGTNTGSPSVY